MSGRQNGPDKHAQKSNPTDYIYKAWKAIF